MNALLTDFGGLHPLVEAPLWVVLLLKITVILSAAWVAHLAIARFNPRWRVFFWRATAVGLVVLPVVAWLLPAVKIYVQRPGATEAVVASSVLAVPIIESQSPAGMQTDLPKDFFVSSPSHDTAANLPPVGANKLSNANVTSQSASSPPQTVAQMPSKHSFFTWPLLLSAAWLGGILTLVFRLSLGQYRVYRLVRRAKSPPQWVCDGCMNVSKEIGCPGGVELLQSADIASPFLCLPTSRIVNFLTKFSDRRERGFIDGAVAPNWLAALPPCGLRRPRLLLPARMCDEAYIEDLPGILAHELTHVRSRDLRWNLGLQLISILLWPHPLAWRMRKAHLSACELVCDAASANYVGDATRYSRTLARVAVDACTLLPNSGIAMARTSQIGRRLAALKKTVFHLPLRRRSVLAFGLVAFLGVAVTGALQFALAESAPVESVATADKTKAKPAGKESQGVKDTDVKATAETPGMRVLDLQGKPLPGAKVKIETGNQKQKLLADSITLTSGKDVTKRAIKPGFRPMQVRVVDSDGKPIVDANITVRGVASMPYGPIQLRAVATGITIGNLRKLAICFVYGKMLV